MVQGVPVAEAVPAAEAAPEGGNSATGWDRAVTVPCLILSIPAYYIICGFVTEKRSMSNFVAFAVKALPK